MGELARLAPGPSPARQRAAGGEARDPLREMREPRHPVAQVEERGERRRDAGVARQLGHQPLPQGQAVAGVVVVQELDLHPGHVDAGRAFPAAGLAGDAQVHRALHLGTGEGVRPKLPGDREPEGVGPPAGKVLLLARGPIGRAHRPARELPAGAVVVAHLDRRPEPAPVRPVEGGLRGRRDAVVGLEAEQPAVVESGCADDLAGVEVVRRIEGVLHGLERPGQARAEERFDEFRARETVAVLARVGAVVAAHQLRGLLRDGAHPGDVAAELHVEDRAHVQAADRGVGVPRAAGAVLGEHLGDGVGVVGEVFERHRAILDEGDRLRVALHRHHDVEAGLADLPDGALARRLHHLDHRAGEAVVAHAGVEAPEVALERREVVARELRQQQAVRLPAGDVGERRAEQRDVGTEHQHVVVHEFHGDRGQIDDRPRRLHRGAEGGEVAHAHDPVGGQA